MKKIITFIVALTLSTIVIGCSKESEEPIEYKVVAYSLQKSSLSDNEFESMIISVNADKMSEKEAVKIVNDIKLIDDTPNITFTNDKSRQICKSYGDGEGNVCIDFEDKMESKSNREIKNITIKGIYDKMVQDAKERVE